MVNVPRFVGWIVNPNDGNITIWRCEQTWGTHREIWQHKNDNIIEVKSHTYLQSKEGKRLKSKLSKSKIKGEKE